MFQYAAAVAALIYPFGVPFFFFVAMYRQRSHLSGEKRVEVDNISTQTDSMLTNDKSNTHEDTNQKVTIIAMSILRQERVGNQTIRRRISQVKFDIPGGGEGEGGESKLSPPTPKPMHQRRGAALMLGGAIEFHTPQAPESGGSSSTARPSMLARIHENTRDHQENLIEDELLLPGQTPTKSDTNDEIGLADMSDLILLPGQTPTKSGKEDELGLADRVKGGSNENDGMTRTGPSSNSDPGTESENEETANSEPELELEPEPEPETEVRAYICWHGLLRVLVGVQVALDLTTTVIYI
jgi:hypothetical protein